jgi:hypothetical protein
MGEPADGKLAADGEGLGSGDGALLCEGAEGEEARLPPLDLPEPDGEKLLRLPEEPDERLPDEPEGLEEEKAALAEGTALPLGKAELMDEGGSLAELLPSDEALELAERPDGDEGIALLE